MRSRGEKMLQLALEATANIDVSDISSVEDPVENIETDEDLFVPSESSEEDEDETHDNRAYNAVHEHFPKRKRKAAWGKEVRQEKRLKGEHYLGVKGEVHAARPLLPSPCLGLKRHDCDTKVPEKDRKQIHEAFRNLGSLDEQRVFIAKHIAMKPKNRSTTNKASSRRTYTHEYSLTVNKCAVPVCRTFFMCTLNVTDALIRSSLKKVSENGVVEKDRRGQHVPHNKTPVAVERFIHDFIHTFSAVESHYCRSSTTKKYLDSSLNISILHRMYIEKSTEIGLATVKLEKFRRIFKEYNLGFFQPKKDQCKVCLAYYSSHPEGKEIRKVAFEKHQRQKTLARQARDEDKKLAAENSTCLAFNFDLEAVLCTPKGSAGQIFYLRKLAVYNFTVFDLTSHDGQCFLWDESQGNRGTNEIASCLLRYLRDKCANSDVPITTIRMMSDSCGGQNKNTVIAALCIFVLKTIPNLTTIRHSFFEPGHSEMECDSIHAKIEKKVKNVPVYVPEGWAQVIRGARLNPQPFVVNRMTFSDFLNFKPLADSLKSKIPWRQLCSIEYQKLDTEDGPLVTVRYKTSYDDSNFMEVSLAKTTPGTIRTRKRRISKKHLTMPRSAYKEQLPISTNKYNDLMKMCQDLIIPPEYHEYYRNLKHSNTTRDALPEPDQDESDESDSE